MEKNNGNPGSLSRDVSGNIGDHGKEHGNNYFGFKA